jgi:uncharacterized protein
MPGLMQALAERWIGRYARPDPTALAAVAGLTPCVVVTGGSAGIGLAIAQRFHRDGETVVLIARDPGRLAAATTGFAGPGRIATLALDVTNPDAPARIESALHERGLYLDILVNCAGIGLAGPFANHDSGAIEQLVATNVNAVTRLTRHVLPALLARGRGGIINVASLGGYVPGPNQAAYYASKAYVCSLTEALATENAGRGVRITAVAPGPVATSFHAKMGTGSALYRWLLPALSSDRVARAAVTAYRLGRPVVVPGIVPKALAVAITLLPHWVSAALIRALLAPR